MNVGAGGAERAKLCLRSAVRRTPRNGRIAVQESILQEGDPGNHQQVGMIVLDTTILVYAVGGGRPLQEPCLRLLDRVRARLAGTGISTSDQLVSADMAFSSVPGLAHVAPGTPQFDELLAEAECSVSS